MPGNPAEVRDAGRLLAAVLAPLELIERPLGHICPTTGFHFRWYIMVRYIMVHHLMVRFTLYNGALYYGAPFNGALYIMVHDLMVRSM